MSAIGDIEGCHQREGKVGQELGTHRAGITFSNINANIATLAKGVHLRALNEDPEAAWID